MQLLMPSLADPRVQAVVEYSEETQTAEWTFRYGGPRLDLTRKSDDLGLTVLKGMTAAMDYVFDENAPLPNRLILKIRQPGKTE